MEKNISAGKIPLIQLKDIYKIYQMGDEEVRASDGISLTIEKGEFVAIVGKSGSGKSTLMNIIGALDVPTEGEYLLDGQDVSDMTDNQLAQIRNTMIGFVFQQYNLLPKLNLLENVELPLLYAGMDPWDRRERAMESLERGRTERKVEEFSKAAFRRPAAEGLHCQGPGGKSVADPGRRAHRRPGFQNWPGGSGFFKEAQPGGKYHRYDHPRQLHCPGGRTGGADHRRQDQF